MSRGRVTCAYCSQPIVWKTIDTGRGYDGRWTNFKDGGFICPPAPDHKHRIASA